MEPTKEERDAMFNQAVKEVGGKRNEYAGVEREHLLASTFDLAFFRPIRAAI